MASNLYEIEQLAGEKVIESLDNASHLTPGSEEKAVEINNARICAEVTTKLYETRTENNQLRSEKIKFVVKSAIDVAAIVIPIIAFNRDLKLITLFEDKGYFGSQIGKSMCNRVTDFLKTTIRK